MPVFLKNGEEVKVNDHVYCSPGWAVRDGTPYSVARIMEFLQPKGSSKGKSPKNGYYDRVRLAWYYRPSDVCDINQLRAKCHVVHRDKISDLAGWKRRPDRFYFNRLFDPYIKKEFEVIQSTDVRNLPEHIRNTLITRYEYVVAEKEVIFDLTDKVRLCKSCQEWCPNPDTVQCDRCKGYFHMACVQPPLLAKPSRGYGWTCAPCSRKHEEEVDSHDVRHTTPVITPTTKPKTNAPAPRGRGRPRKDRTQAEKEENFPVKHFKLWPFRYFGQYTVAEDTLDSDDFIFPRAATRIGPKFQANVPATPEEAVASDFDDRGGDSSVEVLSNVNEMTFGEEAEMDVLMSRLTDGIEVHLDVDWQMEAVRRFSDAFSAGRLFSIVNMNSPMRSEKWKKHETRFTDRPWTREEKAAFDDGISHHGAELRAIRDMVGTRTMPEVVRYYGHWKNSKLGIENARIREFGPPSREDVPIYPVIPLNGQGQQHVGMSDDEGSVVSTSSKTINICGACRTRESMIWWKAPKGLATDVLCDTCGTNWRKYADINVRPLREESLPINKAEPSGKRGGTPLMGPAMKRARTSASVQSTPPPLPNSAPQVRCLGCNKNGPMGKVMKCKKCQFGVHAGSCGAVVDPASVESWLCELCDNDNTLESSLNTDCLLCPRMRKDLKKLGVVPAPDSFLRACKPTEGQGWAHVLCSVFISELSFTDSSRLRSVEGISTIPYHRWATICVLCKERGGAVIRCNDCSKEYHTSCAWNHGYKFGFEMQPVKSTRRDTTTITTFKGETGSMNPVVFCKEHSLARRDIYGICETNEVGETALQIYCENYKQAPIGQAHDLLRKARRLDQILSLKSDMAFPSLSPDNTESSTNPECYQCHTQFSPQFYRLPPSVGSFMAQGVPNAWLCHRCQFETRESPADVSAIAVS